MMEQLLAEIRDEAFESATNGSFVNAEDASDLDQGSTVKKVCHEQKAIARVETAEGNGNGVIEALELSSCRCNRRRLRSDIKRIEWSLAMHTSMVIHMPLGQDGTQPTHERTTTGVRRQRRTALSVDLTETEELGVDGVSQVVAHGGGASDGGGGTGQGLTVEREKAFPRQLATESAGVRRG
jgi:hypothetical protein